jgi:CBS domain containing-hemolysin-like protein
MTDYDWFAIAVVLVCILLSAFFAGSETALTASSRAAMHRLEKQGNRRAALVNRLVEARERMIGALLFGNNAVNIAASSLATGVLLSWFGEVGVIYATIVMTILIVVFADCGLQRAGSDRARGRPPDRLDDQDARARPDRSRVGGEMDAAADRDEGRRERIHTLAA